MLIQYSTMFDQVQTTAPSFRIISKPGVTSLSTESTLRLFLVATIDGFQILRLEQIVYLRYNTEAKRWVAVLKEMNEVSLRRNTKAKDILGYSSLFMQINRDHIVNIDYLSMVKGKECILTHPFDKVKDLGASSGFIHQLQERFVQM